MSTSHQVLLSLERARWVVSSTGCKRLVLAGLCALVACTTPDTTPDGGDKLGVAVSVPPQAYLVERIAGRRVEVQVMIPSGFAHDAREPSPQQVLALARARLYVKVGHPAFLFEMRFLDPLLLRHPELEVVDMARGIDSLDLPSSVLEAHEARHGDPHVWLAPATMARAANNVAAALSRLDPASAAAYRASLADFQSELTVLDQEISARLAGLPRRRFLIVHPSWGYFAHQYGLEQVAIEVDGKEPSPKQLARLIDKVREENLKVVFVEPGLSDKSARVVAREIGAELQSVDPLAHDWPQNLRHMAQLLADALGSPPRPPGGTQVDAGPGDRSR